MWGAGRGLLSSLWALPQSSGPCWEPGERSRTVFPLFPSFRPDARRVAPTSCKQRVFSLGCLGEAGRARAALEAAAVLGAALVPAPGVSIGAREEA